MTRRKSYRDVVSDVAEETAATEVEIRQLMDRVRPQTRFSRSQTRPRWELPALTALAAACALGLILLASPWLPSSWLEDEVSWELNSGRPTELDVGSLVALVHNGTGWVEGSTRNMAIGWQAGVIDIAVVPGEDVIVNIETPEAQIRVVGTELRVSRMDVSTRISVSKGRVEVRCLRHDGGQGPVVQVAAEVAHTCATTDADVALRQAVRLRGESATPERILEVIAHGLTLATEGPVHYELLAASVGPLLDLGRHQDALTAIETYLAAGDLPRSERFRDLADEIRERDIQQD